MEVGDIRPRKTIGLTRREMDMLQSIHLTIPLIGEREKVQERATEDTIVTTSLVKDRTDRGDRDLGHLDIIAKKQTGILKGVETILASNRVDIVKELPAIPFR
mmetsp:Transcript_64683/g.173369  ORF Transcript_64683/g.173369 Transcript_64683/m.173369 type:complete len:103 (-) Transcript_64683:1589-1897(-)